MLALCSDESIAALLGVDLTIITSAVIHYVYATATPLNRATAAGCRAFGFSGDLAAPLTEDFSLNPHPNNATIAQFLHERADGVLNAIGSLPTHARADTFLTCFDRAAGHLGAIARFSTGARPSRRALFGMRALALCDGWAIVGDKSTSPYWEWRIVALPPFMVSLLKLWCARLEELADRIEDTHPALAARSAPDFAATVPPP